eukprot:11191755-Lingulodinium_polyedra.AAC.1
MQRLRVAEPGECLASQARRWRRVWPSRAGGLRRASSRAGADMSAFPVSLGLSTYLVLQRIDM